MTSATFDLTPFSAVTKASTSIASVWLPKSFPVFCQVAEFLSYTTIGTPQPKKGSPSGLNSKPGGCSTAVQQAVAPDADLGRWR